MPPSESQVWIALDLTYACNYKCPYCVLPPVGKHRPAAEWIKALKRMHEKYGTCHINMSGGEPSVYPGFYDLVPAAAAMHVVDLCTNLSWPVEKLVPKIHPDRLHISPTFHPTQVSFDDFFSRLVFARPYVSVRSPDGRPSVSYVAYPSQMDRMEEYRNKLERGGFSLVPIPLMEDGRIANTEEEKERIEDISPIKGTSDHRLDHQLNVLSPKGRLCRAGQRYVLVRGDGLVDRCTRYEDRQLGNFFSEDFSLWPEPRLCDREWCPFESQWLVREPAGQKVAA